MRAAGYGALALAALLALPGNGCTTPAAAEVRAGMMNVVAAGDTLKTTVAYKVTGSPDSVRWLFTAGNAPSVILSRVAPANGVTLTTGPANLIPAPPLVEGAGTTVSACPVAWKAGSAYPGACSTKLYTRPVTPPTVTVDSLTVIGLEVYPRGTYASTRATSACLQSYRATPDGSGWVPVWDAATNDWKPVCKGANGKPMVLAYCTAMVMGDSMRVLNAQWTTRPWCARYTGQVPRRYVMPPGLTTARQMAAEKAVTKFGARTNQGLPMPGFVWDEPFGMTVVRDTVTADAALLPYAVTFMVSRSLPGGGAFAMPDSAVFLVARLANGDGSPRVGAVVNWGTPCCGGQLSSGTVGESRWKMYGLNPLAPS